ncbi:MAG: oxidoreductase [Actinobacteria bacterium]|nr:oxidoreductase [Actinomycetota bacterium]
MKKIDSFLNKMTMYKAVIYCLLLLIGTALGLSFFKLLPFNPGDLIVSVIFITSVCLLSNIIFAWAFKAPSNIDSVYITALILALIVTPPKPFTNLLFLAWISVIAMASKYIFAIGKKHFLNPAAVSVAIVGLAAKQFASWWVGNLYMVPFVIIGGLLVVRKIRRLDLVISFFTVTLLIGSVFNLISGHGILSGLSKAIIYSPLLFFAFIMLTEPMSMPPTRMLHIIYGAIVGFLFVPQVHIGPLYFSPELALILGNVFVYLVSPDQKLILKLDKIVKQASDTYDFVFVPDKEIDFKPGQYMEITLDHARQDSRGIRRYLTIASSPTEREFRLGVKFYTRPSSLKKSLISMKQGQKIVASQLAGDFTLPKDINRKLVFIAGGIGITPFRSMIKYMLDTNEKRSVTLFYLNKKPDDIAYRNIFDEAEKQLGIKTEYSIVNIPTASYYRSIAEKVPDYKERTFYISGPNAMVSAFEANLKKLGVKKTHIKTDYFPGFA